MISKFTANDKAGQLQSDSPRKTAGMFYRTSADERCGLDDRQANAYRSCLFAIIRVRRGDERTSIRSVCDVTPVKLRADPTADELAKLAWVIAHPGGGDRSPADRSRGLRLRRDRGPFAAGAIDSLSNLKFSKDRVRSKERVDGAEGLLLH